MSVKETMTRKLEAAFAPTRLTVIDESEHHRGHGGWREGGETHFRIQIVSPAFKGKSRVDIHRAINACVADELAASVHALAIEAKAE
jgi:BolA protein